MAEWNLPEVTIALIERAWHWNDRAQVTFWEGLIIAAAELTESRFLVNEEFQASRKFDSVTVVNPFETSLPASSASAMMSHA